MRTFAILGLSLLITSACGHLRVPSTGILAIDRGPTGDTPETCAALQATAGILAATIFARDIPAEYAALLGGERADPLTDSLLAQRLIQGDGYDIVSKPRQLAKISERFATRFATTTPPMFGEPGKVWLPIGFWTRRPKSQATTFIHESIHVRSEKRLRTGGAMAVYVTAAGRLGFEAPAYTYTLDALRRYGGDDRDMRRRAEGIIDILTSSDYGMQGVNRECVSDFLWEVWALKLGLGRTGVRQTMAIEIAD